MLEQQDAQPEGLDIKGLLKTYGPMMAAAVPAILLARGRGGKEILNIIQRLAPKHAAKLHASPIPYFVEQEAPELGALFKGSSAFRSAPMPSSPMNRSGQPFFDAVAPEAFRAAGNAPYFGHINVADTPRKLGSSLHEFGHAVGHQRASEMLPMNRIASGAVSKIGVGHLDQFQNPRSQAMVKEALEKSPYLKDYYAHYLYGKEQQNRPLYEAYGELMNEAWAEKLQRLAGLTPNPITELPAWKLDESQGILKTARDKFFAPVREAERYGTLAQPHISDAVDALTRMLSQWKRAQPGRSSPIPPSR